MGHGTALRIDAILSAIHEMVYGSHDRRATALARLRESENGEPFKILIGTILSHRTRDENTTRAVENLFSVYSTAEELASANYQTVRRLVRPSGFYNVKARNVIRVSRQLVDEFGGKVPQKMDDLLRLHSVGRKTANCVLVYAFGMPAIPVDTHVHRISNRLGLVNTKKPEDTELQLTEEIPRKYWLEVNDLFVRFGQTVCKPIGPKCDQCTLKGDCKYYRSVLKAKRS